MPLPENQKYTHRKKIHGKIQNKEIIYNQKNKLNEDDNKNQR